eukprot:TRINITY_DN9785_c0_g1_i10.p1 TRINITY_DN9785_c0_g1~~TRINITY_DN9785_c0_g1_i10.p1  ORF type:complete len:195 (-),score=38.63 TRINITY_DN9785_c0_g1_i10:405-989(-)
MSCVAGMLLLVWGYVKGRSRKASLDALVAVSAAMEKGLVLGPETVVWKEEEYHLQAASEEDSLQDADAGLLSSLVDNVLPSSLNSTLRMVQNLLGSVCVAIESGRDVFQWKSSTASLGLLAGLALSATVCALLPLRWLVLFVGSVIFFGNTGPFAGLRWVLSGLNRYLTRRRASAIAPKQARVATDHVNTSIQS